MDKYKRLIMERLIIPMLAVMLILPATGTISPCLGDWGDSFGVSINPQWNWVPETITDLAGAGGAAEGAIDLSWSAPKRDPSLVVGGSVDGYFIRYATYSIAELGGDTTAWWESAGLYAMGFASESGVLETETFAPGVIGTTYYISIKSYNELGPVVITSLIDAESSGGAQVAAVSRDITPVTPAGLNVTGTGTNSITLGWTDMTGSAGYMDFSHYLIMKSTDYGISYIEVSTVTANSWTDTGLLSGVSYYYRISAVDMGPDVRESAATAGIAGYIEPPVIITDTTRPRPPGGIRLERSAGGIITVIWSWSRINENGTLYADRGVYRVYRSRQMRGSWALVGTVGDIGQTPASFTDSITVDIRDVWYYMVTAVDTSGNESAGSMLCDTSADFNVIGISADGKAYIMIPRGLSNVLYKAGENAKELVVEIIARDIAGINGAIAWYEYTAYNTDLWSRERGLRFSKAGARVVIQHELISGAIRKAPGDNNELMMYWHNGVEWVRIASEQKVGAVESETGRLGSYMIRLAARAHEFILNAVYPKVFTPNGDGLNDKVEFQYENPLESDVIGRIYDLSGRIVGEMRLGENGESLQWDGRTVDGDRARPGAYIYQIEITGTESKVINGVVVVAE